MQKIALLKHLLHRNPTTRRKSTLAVAVVWNIPITCNRSSADFLISSSLMMQDYPRGLPDYEDYGQRFNR